MSFIATKHLLLADQFSNGSDLPDLTTIQEYKEALPRLNSKQRLISFRSLNYSSLNNIIRNIIRFHFRFRKIIRITTNRSIRRIFYLKKYFPNKYRNESKRRRRNRGGDISIFREGKGRIFHSRNVEIVSS